MIGNTKSALLLIFWIASLAVAGSGPMDVRHHSLIRVVAKDVQHEKALFQNHDLDIMPNAKPGDVQVAAFPENLTWLALNGYGYELIHADLEEFYARRGRDRDNLDLMGGYRTYSEIVTFLDNLHASYPAITTEKDTIGVSLEGRVQWGMKISDNPESDEDEPEVFFNSLIHAREPAAMEAVLETMQHLCQNYASNSDIQYLVDNREMWFVPCLNPDGYVYNQTTNPNGGGMWRKNRRNNGTSFGVDLNRNFSYLWGLDNTGSSPTPSSETYRGPSAASEPETQAFQNWVNSRRFVVSINYHTYSNLLLKPWGTSTYQGGYTEDDATFDVLIDSMQYWIESVNGAVYATGTPWELLYNVNGSCDDWCYGDDTERNRIFGITPEVGDGTDGFWPVPARIPELVAENLQSNLFIARYAEFLVPPAQRVQVQDHIQTETAGDFDGLVEPGESFSLSVGLLNTGSLDVESTVGLLTTSDPNVTITSASSTWPTIAPDGVEYGNMLFQIDVSPSAPEPHGIQFALILSATSGLDTSVSVGAVIGSPTFADNMEGGANGWTNSGGGSLWHLSTRRAASPTHSWYSGDEGTGQYDNGMNAALTSPSFTLGVGIQLSFWHYHELESDFDFGFVEVNTGTGWQQIAGPYTGSSGGWAREIVSLSAYPPGATTQIRFRMTSDQGLTEEGWYIDDVQVMPPPNASVNPGELTVGILPGEIEILEVIVENSGSGELAYTTGFGSGSAVADTGGPDAFGYRWQDNNDPCGPTYTWIDISALGQQLVFTNGDQILGAFNLPFEFPFYGTAYTRFWVSANGWISFTDSTTVLAVNTCFPSANGPSGCIAGWWDDLKPQLAGANVRYWHNGVDSAAVLYENVVAGSAPNQGNYTFMILLQPDGDIRVFYEDMGTLRLESATIGIQDPSKSTGLAVLCNDPGIANNQARRFAMGPRWVSVLPVSGTLGEGERDTLRVSFYGSLLCGDPSTSALHVRSNDPETPLIAIPLTATIQVTPNDPSGLTVIRDGDDAVLRWDASAGATGYRIERAIVSDGPYTSIGTATDPTFTDSGAALTPGNYFYQVIATN